MKKFFAFILALVMALSLMACGGGAAKPADDHQNAGVDAGVEDGVDSAADPAAPVVTDGATLGEGQHSFTLEIADADGKMITATINTDEETVGAALSKLNIVQGDQGDFGLYIKTVNGVTADYDKDKTYWAFYIDGEYASTAADMTAITDGSVYKLAITQ